MVTLTASLTLPVNPPASSSSSSSSSSPSPNPNPNTPHLTAPELYQILLFKCRKPELFVAPIKSSRIISESLTYIERVCVFENGFGTATTASGEDQEQTEQITLTAPWKAEFVNVTTGARVSNVISLSQGPEEVEGELYLSFFFAWPFEGLGEEGDEAGVRVREKERELWGLARRTVQGTIEHARRMKGEGRVWEGGYRE